MNIRWNIILGVIALALLGWYYSLNQDHGDLQSLIKSLIAQNTSVIKWKRPYSRQKEKTISRDFRTKWNITHKTAIRILFRR